MGKLYSFPVPIQPNPQWRQYAMELDIETAQKVSNLRLRIVENMDAGRDSFHGINEDDLREALAKIRKSRSVSAATTKSKSSTPDIPIDLNAFLSK